jgi:hypothetical protein
LTGEFSEGAATAFRKGMAVVISLPIFALSALMMFLGIRSMAAPDWVGDLGVCLWAGLAILFAWSLLLVHILWRMPRRTISSFALNDGQFTCTTLRDGTRTYPASTLKLLKILASKRSIYGWLIRFADSKRLQIDADMPNANKLVRELQTRR